MRDEDQLPQKLITMVERAEHEMKMLGGGTLSVRDLVILSAVVPRVEEPDPILEGSGEMILVGTGTLDRGSDALVNLRDEAIDQYRRGECEELESGKAVKFDIDDLVVVTFGGETMRGKFVGNHGEKLRIKLDGDLRKYRVYEAKCCEAI